MNLRFVDLIDDISADVELVHLEGEDRIPQLVPLDLSMSSISGFNVSAFIRGRDGMSHLLALAERFRSDLAKQAP